ncbi:MAG: hypothetical protein ACTHWU_04540 [Senegalia sp. (in: firmicutes)]|uniref:hypothetical protein n=1 Tax=Senegalia sp. (in: firmicutes) TaxID=1924098 RepID=UPI003F9D0EB4
MKKRKLISILLILAFVMAIVPMVALADDNYDDDYEDVVEQVKEDVARTNESIARKVKTAQFLADLPGMSERHIDKIIDRLVKVTDKEAKAMIDRAAKLGVVVECHYDLYIIGGREVWIDPLIVPTW